VIFFQVSLAKVVRIDVSSARAAAFPPSSSHLPRPSHKSEILACLCLALVAITDANLMDRPKREGQNRRHIDRRPEKAECAGRRAFCGR